MKDWLLAIMLALVPLSGALAPTAPAPPGYLVRIYAKNTLYGLGDEAAMARDIQASQADVVLLQELRSGTRLITELGQSHPHQHICQFTEWTGTAVFSRWPLEETWCSETRSFAAARVLGPEGAFWAVSTHLIWPYPYDQRRALDPELPFLSSLNGPVIVGGDFNMAPWGQAVRDISEATGTNQIGPSRITIRPYGIPLSIDHIYATGEGATNLRPLFGSDHHGLLAVINLPSSLF